MSFVYYSKEGKFILKDDEILDTIKFHRLDGPAIEWDFGGFDWWVNGKRHREDGPAIDWPGYKVWYVNDKLHRLDGPAVIQKENNFGLRKEWWVNGKLHRADGPAIEYENGDKEWWINDKRHRLDGPAVVRLNGGDDYFINNKKLNTIKVKEWIKNNNIDLSTKKGKSLFKLKFG